MKGQNSMRGEGGTPPAHRGHDDDDDDDDDDAVFT